MTYNALIPLNSDSPSLFPAQSQANYTRLQTIISADHVFNLDAAANDGYHNLVHLTQQAPAGALAATGRLYVKTVNAFIQLYYMDDAGVEYQITPFYDTVPTKVNGSMSLAGGASTNVLNVAYDFSGFGTTFIAATGTQRTYNFYRSGATTYIKEINSDSSGPARPTLQFVGTVLTAKNNSGGVQNIVWSLMVNRL